MAWQEDSSRSKIELCNCVVSHDFQQGTVFSHESGRSIRVVDAFQAVYNGSRLAIGTQEQPLQ